jgi:hypothetical protein
VAAINPDDLDALDESLPLTKFTLDNLLGRKHTNEEYQYYFERNPHGSLYVDVYGRFLAEETVARKIVSEKDREARERKAGVAPSSEGATSGAGAGVKEKKKRKSLISVFGSLFK